MAPQSEAKTHVAFAHPHCSVETIMSFESAKNCTTKHISNVCNILGLRHTFGEKKNALTPFMCKAYCKVTQLKIKPDGSSALSTNSLSTATFFCCFEVSRPISSPIVLNHPCSNIDIRSQRSLVSSTKRKTLKMAVKPRFL